MPSVYLDNASTSFPKPACVPEAVYRYMTACGSNVSRGGYQAAYSAEELVFETRQQRLRAVSWRGRALRGLYAEHHHEPQHPAQRLSASGRPRAGVFHGAQRRHAPTAAIEVTGVRFDRIPCRTDGTLVLDAMEGLVRENTKLVLCLHASNVCGTLLPIDAIGAFCHRHGLRFFLTARRLRAFSPIDMQQSYIDAVAFTGHKSLMARRARAGSFCGKTSRGFTPLLAGGTGSMSHTEFMPDFLPRPLGARHDEPPRPCGTSRRPRLLAGNGAGYRPRARAGAYKSTF